MQENVRILLAEDDDGHAALIVRNLERAGISNEITRFMDGREILNFLMRDGVGPHRESNQAYLLLLDVRMPRVDGLEVLRKIKQHAGIRRLPVIMLTTTDDPREIQQCYDLGCSNYISKPVDYDDFIASIRQLGLFLMVVEVPTINGVP